MGTEDEPKDEPLIEYPSVYAFKVMGKQEGDFAGHVRRLFQRLMGREISDDSIRTRASSGGKYVSVEVNVVLLSEEQRRSIYQALHEDERVVYLL